MTPAASASTLAGAHGSDRGMMRAWATASAPGSWELVDRPVPTPADGEVLVRVEACGVCRTDLHVIDRELPIHLDRVTPGHQVVGSAAALDIAPSTTTYPFEHAADALDDLRAGRSSGSLVVAIGPK